MPASTNALKACNAPVKIVVGTHPWLVKKSIDFLREYLTPESHVLECGAGGSTIWMLETIGVARLVSLEHDEKWATAVRSDVSDDSALDLQTCPLPYHHLLEDYGDEEFDLVLIDGRDRMLCLEASRRLIKPGGYLLLDNAERDRYQSADRLLKGWEKKSAFVKWETAWWQKP
jgi:predicted O-methyltransferase YrrM